MASDVRTKLTIPLAAAVAVAAVLGGVWVALHHDGDDHASQPGVRSGAPVTPAPTGHDPTPDPNLVRIDGYQVRTPTQLGLNYTIGVPACYGYVGQPVVLETDKSVVVTLPRIPPKGDADRACIDIAMLKTVYLTLAAPLGDRLVRDGSTGERVHEADSRYPEMTE